MEAIGELLAAMLFAFAQAVGALIRIAASTVLMFVEFLVMLLLQGRAEATQRYQQRRELIARRKHADNAATNTQEHSSSTQHGVSSFALPATIAIIVTVVVAAALVAGRIAQEIRKRRIEATTTQLEKLAHFHADRIKADERPPPHDQRAGWIQSTKTELPNVDSWKQPIQLFVDRSLLGTLIVVRSAGPDRKTGTIDDLLAIETVPATKKELAKEVAKRGAQALRKRLEKLVRQVKKQHQNNEDGAGDR